MKNSLELCRIRICRDISSSCRAVEEEEEDEELLSEAAECVENKR